MDNKWIYLGGALVLVGAAIWVYDYLNPPAPPSNSGGNKTGTGNGQGTSTGSINYTAGPMPGLTYDVYYLGTIYVAIPVTGVGVASGIGGTPPKGVLFNFGTQQSIIDNAGPLNSTAADLQSVYFPDATQLSYIGTSTEVAQNILNQTYWVSINQ